jgi:hypothetical protein
MEAHVHVIDSIDIPLPPHTSIRPADALASIAFETGVVEAFVRAGDDERALWHLGKLRRIARLGLEGGQYGGNGDTS